MTCYEGYSSKTSSPKKARTSLEAERHDGRLFDGRRDERVEAVREDDAVRVRVEDVDDGVGLDEALDLAEDEGPLQLVLRLVGRRVVVDVLRQLAHQVAHQLHLLQQEADDDEPGVVSELFHHQVGP